MQAQNPPAGPIARIMTAFDFPMSADFAEQFGKRLVALREAKGLTQAAVAAKLGITLGRYGHYERGFRRLPVQLVAQLAEALECSESELLGAPQPKVKRGPPSEWEKRFTAIKELPRDKQREIQNVVDALIAKAS